MIFLAGTNLDGRHGAGSARYAYLHHGLKMGIAEGLSGNSYAIPTVGHHFQIMDTFTVIRHIQRFIDFAQLNPDLEFQVTRIGCGLAGFKDSEIAPLFASAPSNCLFDTAWKTYLPDARFWGTF